MFPRMFEAWQEAPGSDSSSFKPGVERMPRLSYGQMERPDSSVALRVSFAQDKPIQAY